jgi:hypothetical protein
MLLSFGICSFILYLQGQFILTALYCWLCLHAFKRILYMMLTTLNQQSIFGMPSVTKRVYPIPRKPQPEALTPDGTNPSPPLEAFPTIPNTLNWKNINVKKAMPTMILPTALAWGVGNWAEHELHTGHLAHKLPKPLIPVVTTLAVAVPAITVAYGALDAMGMFLAGYAWRSLGFTTLAGIAGVTALELINANRWAAENGKILQFLAEKADTVKEHLAKENGFTELAKELEAAGLKTVDPNSKIAKTITEHDLRAWTKARNTHWVVQSLVPFLFGFSAITKVKQTLPAPDGQVEHPKGNTVNELWGNTTALQPQCIFVKNLVAETQGYGSVLSQLPMRTKQVQEAFTTIVLPPDEAHSSSNKVAPEQTVKVKSLPAKILEWGKKSPLTSLIYLTANIGFVGSALLSAGLIASGNKHLLVQEADAFKPLADALVKEHKLKVQKLKNPLIQPTVEDVSTLQPVRTVAQGVLSVGQTGAAFAALITTFSDWPAGLSLLYRASAIPYIGGMLAGFFGGDKIIFTKFAGFMQTSAYALFLLNTTKKAMPPTPPSSSTETAVLAHQSVGSRS